MRTALADCSAEALQWSADGAVFLSRSFPRSAAYRVSAGLGRLIRNGAREKVREHVAMVLGDEYREGSAANDFWEAHVRHIGLTCLEPLYMLHSSDAELINSVDMVGEDHLRRALAAGDGAVLFLNHLGSPGAIVAGFGMRDYDLTIAGNRIMNPSGERDLKRLEELVQRMFRRGRVKRVLLGDSLPRRAAECLERNGIFAMFTDFPAVTKHNVTLPFGRGMMTVNIGPALLALRHRVPILNVTCLRTGVDRHEVRIHPPIEIPEDGSLRERAVAVMRQSIGQSFLDLEEAPDQWWPWDWARIESGELEGVTS